MYDNLVTSLNCILTTKSTHRLKLMFPSELTNLAGETATICQQVHIEEYGLG